MSQEITPEYVKELRQDYHPACMNGVLEEFNAMPAEVQKMVKIVAESVRIADAYLKLAEEATLYERDIETSIDGLIETGGEASFYKKETARLQQYADKMECFYNTTVEALNASNDENRRLRAVIEEAERRAEYWWQEVQRLQKIIEQQREVLKGLIAITVPFFELLKYDVPAIKAAQEALSATPASSESGLATENKRLREALEKIQALSDVDEEFDEFCHLVSRLGDIRKLTLAAAPQECKGDGWIDAKHERPKAVAQANGDRFAHVIACTKDRIVDSAMYLEGLNKWIMWGVEVEVILWQPMPLPPAPASTAGEEA